MNLKTIIAQIDLSNGALDNAGNSIAYPVRAALVNTARQIVQLRRENTEVPEELHARVAALKAINEALEVIFLLRPMDMTARFVLGINEDQQPRDFEAEVRRDIELGRVFVPNKQAFDRLITSREELARARRNENLGLLNDVLTVIDASPIEFDQELVEDVVDAVCEKIAKAAIDAKDRIQRELERSFLPARYERLQGTLLGIEQLLNHLGLTHDALESMKAKRRAHLDTLLGDGKVEAAPAEPTKKRRVVKAEVANAS